MFPGRGTAWRLSEKGTACVQPRPSSPATFSHPALASTKPLGCNPVGPQTRGFTLYVQERQEKASCKPPPTPEARARSLV